MVEPEDQTYFSTPKFDSVIDRYYKRYFKRLTPVQVNSNARKPSKSVAKGGISLPPIQAVLDGNKEELKVEIHPCLDQCYLAHSNKIVILTLAPTHEIITDELVVTKVNFDINKKANRSDMVVTGKKKLNATDVAEKTILCELEVEGGKQYKIRSFIRARLLEINERAIENPDLVRLKVSIWLVTVSA